MFKFTNVAAVAARKPSQLNPTLARAAHKSSSRSHPFAIPHSHQKSTVAFKNLGVVPYAKALQLQQHLVAWRIQQTATATEGERQNGGDRED
ncbi:hypothetical protein HK102_006508, partial [Quaeritorhiza haematococci]